jgi:hypothetical protein
MRLKIPASGAHDGDSLCGSCRYSTITRGHVPREEIVQCEANPMRPLSVGFKVASCTAYFDARLPTYSQLLEKAWILTAKSKKQPAGFVRHADMSCEEQMRLRIEPCVEDRGGDE